MPASFVAGPCDSEQTDRPTTPAEIHATMYAALGYDVRSISYQSSDGRPIALTEGTPINELF